MITLNLKALIARQMRLLGLVAAIAGLVAMLGAQPAQAQYGPTTGTLSASTTTPDDTQPVTFTAVFSTVNLGPPPFGEVDFIDGVEGPVIGSFQLEPQNHGTATFTTSSLSPGTHHIYANYDGFGDIPAGQTNTVTIQVSSNEYGPTTGNISAPQTFYTGQPISVTVTISVGNLGPPPFGKVDLYDQFSTIIASAQLEPQDNGTVVFMVDGSMLESGDNYLVGYYEGFGNIPAGSTSNDIDIYNPD